MRRPILTILGALLFVAGVGVGVALDRSGALDWPADPAGPRVVPAPIATGETDAKDQARQGLVALEDDQRALLGLWIQPQGPGFDPKILSFHEGAVKVCYLDRAATLSSATFLIRYLLATEGSRRVLLDADRLESEKARVPLFSYRLEGDTLQLERMVPADYGDMYDYDLGGKWFRLHYQQEAKPAVVVDPGR